ncbi:hypothetical protein [Oscillibacter sp.]|uniref:hypothetical protein n=1 Tax=Oscillibacter sp. TaxID=1945593 RepID=UPI00289846BB|nr:hypothetical protein [Oscillibacter sp.]
MKFNLSLKNKEVNLEADVEGLVEKNLEHKSLRPDKKTRYQIKQEEKRKTEAQKHKQQMRYLYILLGIAGICTIIGIVASVLGI